MKINDPEAKKKNQEFYHALLQLSIKAHISMLSEKDIECLLKNLSFSNDQIHIINEFLKELNDIQSNDDLRINFNDLEWRLETKVRYHFNK